MINILIADDHPIVRRGIKQVLSEASDISVEEEAGSCGEVLRKLKEKRFDVVLLDIAMPGGGGIEVLKQMRISGIRPPVLILSIFPEELYAMRALEAGASGYLMKSCEADILIKAIRKVAAGGKYISDAVREKLLVRIGDVPSNYPHELLSNREYEVMREIALGKSMAEIAREMALSVKTVSTYRARILQKMHLSTTAELTHYAMVNRLVN